MTDASVSSAISSSAFGNGITEHLGSNLSDAHSISTLYIER